MKLNLKIISLLFMISLLAISAAYADDSNETADKQNIKTFTELETILNNSDSGATINLDCDYEYDDGFKDIGVELINKTVTINGNGHALDGKNSSRILNVLADNVVISNITFRNGYSSESIGALRCHGNNITITNCVFINNNANGSSAGTEDAVGIVAGGIYINGNDNRIKYTTFINNTVGGSGGGLALDGDRCIIEHNYFENNRALRHMNGGAMQIGRGSYSTIRYNIFKDNYAGMGGGAVELQHSRGDVIEKNAFIHNGADYGGGLSIYNTSYFTLKDNEFEDNYADGPLGIGGSLRIYLIDFKTTSVISGNKIKSSTASVSGGAFYIYGSNIKITKNTFANNTAAKQGGGIINALGNDITVSGNEIVNSTAATCGGSIYIDGNNTKITSNNILNSKAMTGGGAIYVKGNSVTVNSNNIRNSSAGTHSGAAYVEGNNTILSNNDFKSNSATSFGGGAYVNGANSRILKNNFTDNSAGASSKAGALRTTGHNATISENIFSGNTAGTGSDILVWNGDNTRITGNSLTDYEPSAIAYYGRNIVIQDNDGIIDKTRISVSSKTFAITLSKSLTATLTNSKGMPISGKTITFTINKKTYKAKTNLNGQATVKITLSKLGKYKCIVKFAKDSHNLASSKTVNLKVVKQATKLTAKNKKFKKSLKAKKITVTLKTSTGKALSKKKITLKINGKTYNGKTNSKGKVTIKIKLTKRGNFKTVIKFQGTKSYKSSSKVVLVKIK